MRISILLIVALQVLVTSATQPNAQTRARGLKLVPHRISLAKGKSFDLNLPEGFAINVAAQGLRRVRFMAKSPDGNGNAAGAMQAVRLNRPFSLRAGQQVTVKGERLRIKFVAVEEDSRCPANVTCVWAGNAAVRLEFSTSRRDRKSLTLNTANSSTLVGERQYHGYKVRLLGLNPYPQSDQKIGVRDYVVTLVVSKDRAVQTVGVLSGTTHREPHVADIDRVRLAEAFRVGERLGKRRAARPPAAAKGDSILLGTEAAESILYWNGKTYRWEESEGGE